MSNIETQANALFSKNDAKGLQKLQDKKGITAEQFKSIQEMIELIG